MDWTAPTAGAHDTGMCDMVGACVERVCLVIQGEGEGDGECDVAA